MSREFESKRYYFLSFLSIENWYLINKKCKSPKKTGARHLKLVLFGHNPEDTNTLQCDTDTQGYVKTGVMNTHNDVMVTLFLVLAKMTRINLWQRNTTPYHYFSWKSRTKNHGPPQQKTIFCRTIWSPVGLITIIINDFLLKIQVEKLSCLKQ